MKIERFNENNKKNRKYLNVDINVCPVCGEKNDIDCHSSTYDSVGGDYLNITSNDNFYIDYECKVCDFMWWSEFNFKQCSDNLDGDLIDGGLEVPKQSYSPEKIDAKKYNL